MRFTRNIYWNEVADCGMVIIFEGKKYKVISQSSQWKKGAYCQGYYTTISEVK